MPDKIVVALRAVFQDADEAAGFRRQSKIGEGCGRSDEGVRMSQARFHQTSGRYAVGFFAEFGGETPKPARRYNLPCRAQWTQAKRRFNLLDLDAPTGCGNGRYSKSPSSTLVFRHHDAVATQSRFHQKQDSCL